MPDSPYRALSWLQDHTHTHSHTHTHTHTHARARTRQISGRVISPKQRSRYLPTHNTHTRSQETRHPCPRRYSNPQYQQASGHRPTPQTARPLRLAWFYLLLVMTVELSQWAQSVFEQQMLQSVHLSALRRSFHLFFYQRSGPW